MPSTGSATVGSCCEPSRECGNAARSRADDGQSEGLSDAATGSIPVGLIDPGNGIHIESAAVFGTLGPRITIARDALETARPGLGGLTAIVSNFEQITTNSSVILLALGQGKNE